MTDKNALAEFRRKSKVADQPDNGGNNATDYILNVMTSAALATPRSSSSEAAVVTVNGIRSLKPTDAIESALSAQIVTANDTALELYRRAWLPNESFEVRAKYLALADRSARTVAALSDALDRRRGRGQQQVVVKHVSVTADQALVADQIVSGRQGVGMSTETGVNPMRKAHEALRCQARSKRTGLPCRAPAVKGCRVCRMHGAGGGAPRGARNGRFRTGLFTAEVVDASRAVRAIIRHAKELEEPR